MIIYIETLVNDTFIHLSILEYRFLPMPIHVTFTQLDRTFLVFVTLTVLCIIVMQMQSKNEGGLGISLWIL